MSGTYLLSFRENNPLNWLESLDGHERLLKEHHRQILQNFLAQVAETPELAASCQALSEDSKLRISIAPETHCATLNHAGNEAVVNRYYASVIQAELIREGIMPNRSEEPIWTALADSGYSREGTYHAPQTEEGITLDFKSFGVDFRPSNHIFGSIKAEYDPSETDPLVKNIRMAMGLLKEYEPAAHRLVGSFTKVIMMKKNFPRTTISNASNEFYIGLITANNSDQYKSVIDYVDCLVHESIHSLVYLIERLHPIIKPTARTEFPHLFERRILSPWSGNKLDIHSLSHACIVWYALAQLWDNMLARVPADHPLRADIEEKYTKAASGFIWTQDLFAQLGTLSGQLNDWTVRFIQDAAESIRNKQTA